ALIGRSIYLPRGRSLGGSSSMNAMIYMRGHRSVFDAWAGERGATGWSYAEVLPYFKRSEGNDRLGAPYHGQAGPLSVVDPFWVSGIGERFVAGAGDAGIVRTDDFNGAEQEGAGLVQLTQKRGRRWSAADAFLHPIRKDRENLEVVTGALAHRILLEGDRAVGVDYEHDGARRQARAEGEVLVCAGAYNSPQLLMLSGIGAADELRAVGIEPRLDSPHVGSHLADHPMLTLTWETNEPGTLFDATHPRYLAEYVVRRGRGKLTSNVAEAAVHTRIATDGEAPDFQFLSGGAYYFDNGFRTFPGSAFTIAPSFVQPRSEGAVRLRSADPTAPPRIELNWLTDPDEMAAMVAACRFAREIAGAGPLAEVVERNLDPGPGVASDEQLEAWIRAECQHTYHPACTCRMGAEDDGVLDPELRVRRVDGLRVVDASSFPSITSGNTNAPVIMVAERAADLVLGRRLLPAEDPAAQPAVIPA
ncbi:MAG TPA: GMC family oxidoreductase N-terminal domain-containing protein, partial [Solirubrobacteraceae bacterium]|nr:GMC family oxidoreductase N-terminal domain-containing protein [Solirubrobacteraceae bacterium]